MFWLRTGTISLVQGSKNAVATGVSFVGEVKPGEILMVGGVLSEIERVVNATTIQLTVAWADASVSNQPYAVIRNITGASNFDLMKNIEAFLTDRQRSMDEFVEWVNGAYDAGVNSNGTFPMTDRYGVTLSVKSPPRLKWESDQLVSSLNVTLASANTQLTAIGNQTTWANQILGYKTEAIAARDKAQKWAEELVDVAVEAGKYSAKHHATKAAASLADVLVRQSDIVTRQADVTTRQADVTTRQADVTTKQTDITARQTNVISLEASTLANKNSSTTNAATATTKAAEAVTSASQSVAARDTAEKWASEADNVVVLAGKYSAKHYAGKALLSETAAATSKTDAEAAKVLAQTAKTGADTAKTGADTAKTLADGSKTAAQAAKTAAETAQAAAEAARDIAVSSAAAVTGGLVDLGQVSLAGGVYPTKPATYSSFWKVTTAGTVAAIPYGIGDTLVYSKTMDEFYKIDNTESVSSINGKTGAVVLENRLGTPLASAATVTVGTAGEAESRHITGNVQITSLGVSVTGVKRELIFDAGLIIVHNATSLVCPGAVNLITAAGMVVDVICENGASGYWRVTNISHSGVSATELGYLDGVSSSIQTQINAKEPSITAGTSAQVFAGDKTWMSFKPAVLATDLLGLSLASASPITYTDSIISGLGKLQKQISDANTAIGTKQASLGYTPVQQGTGAGQTPNTVRMGWSANGLLLQVDATDFANSWPISISKNAATATKLATARTINGVPFDGSANITIPSETDRLPLSGGTMTGAITHSDVGAVQTVTDSWKKSGATIWNMGREAAGDFKLWYYTDAGAFSNEFGFKRDGGLYAPGYVTSPTFNGALAGNAATATKLATARTINGVPFDGSANITIAAGETDRLPLTGGTMTGRFAISYVAPAVPAYNTAHMEISSGGTNPPSISLHRAGYTATVITHTGDGINVFSADGTTKAAVSASAFNGGTCNLSGRATIGDVLSQGWLRTVGAVGWYNESYGGGIYMTDSSYVRTYNGKGFICANDIVIEGTSPTIRLYDTDNAINRYVHTNGGLAGFLKSDGNWGIYNDNAGNTTSSGNLTAYSDIRLKKDIELIPDALAKVMKLRGVTYERIDSGERQTGVIAQEVQAVLPEAVMVGADEDATLSVAYGNLVGLLIEAIKELKAEVDMLKQGAK